MYAEARKYALHETKSPARWASRVPEDSGSRYTFDFFHIGQTISNSLDGVKFLTEKWLEFSEERHAPFESFLKTWYYLPITVWWKTFAPPMFNSVRKFAGKAEEFTAKTPGLSGYGPAFAMLNTFASDMKQQADNFDTIFTGSKKLHDR